MLKQRREALLKGLHNLQQDIENNGIRAAISPLKIAAGIGLRSVGSFGSDVSSPTSSKHDPSSGSKTSTAASSPSSPRGAGDLSPTEPDHSYTLGDHMEYLHIYPETEKDGYYYCDVSHLLCDSHLSGVVKDFLSPLAEHQLEDLYFGLNEVSYRLASSGIAGTHKKPTSGGLTSSPPRPSDTKTADRMMPMDELLPVRTMTMRLGPEVMAAVVLDAVHDACQAYPNATSQVLKRLQGQLQCLIVPHEDEEEEIIFSPTSYRLDDQMAAADATEEAAGAVANKEMKKAPPAPPFKIDAAVVTQRTGMLDRLLLIRIFYASADATGGGGDFNHRSGGSPPSKTLSSPVNSSGTSPPSFRQSSRQVQQATRQVQQAAQENRTQTIQNIHTKTTTNSIIPINLHLRGSCAFFQYLAKQQRLLKEKGSLQNPLHVLCPKASPKGTSAWFMGSLEPTLSVQQQQQRRQDEIYPSLSSKDWALLQSSWAVLSALWRDLSEQDCLIHNYVTPETGPLVLDLHYCTQLRQLSRNRMMDEIHENFADIEKTSERMKASQQRFANMLNRVRNKYQLKSLEEAPVDGEPPRLKEPSSVPPVGFTQLAEMISGCIEKKGKLPSQVCEEVVTKIYKTYWSFDDRQARQYLKDSHSIIMDRVVQIQTKQGKLLEHVEQHPNCQLHAKLFAKQAQLATNTAGRVHRKLLAKVPLVEFDILGGKCKITATSILCSRASGLLGTDSYQLFDLKSIDCIIQSANLMIIQSKAAPQQLLFKLQTSTDLVTLAYFIKTLQNLQAVFEHEPIWDEIASKSLTNEIITNSTDPILSAQKQKKKEKKERRERRRLEALKAAMGGGGQ